MLAATADLPTTAEMKGVEVAYPPRDPSLPERDPDRPRTAVGAVAALSTAKLRIQELEQALEQKSAAAVVPVDKLVPNPWQPRTRFVEATLRELAANIKEVGLLQPILVRRGKSADGDEEFYELIAGERRWRAHQLNGTAEIKALVTEASDADMAVMAVTENINREDLTDFEISKAMIRAEKEFPDRKRMAEAMGLGRATLYRYLSYSKLPQFMIADLEVAPEALGGNAASDTAAVLKKFSLTGADPAIQELWTQVKSGSLDQSKFAATLEATVTKRQSGSPTVTSQRDIHKVYAGKNQAGSITKDAVTFTLKLKSVMLTPAKEERIRGLIAELYGDAPNS
jgi:ParB family chromosome partitioning protein